MVSSKGYAGVPLDLSAPKEGGETYRSRHRDWNTLWVNGQGLGSPSATGRRLSSRRQAKARKRELLSRWVAGVLVQLTPGAWKRLDEGLEGGKGHGPYLPTRSGMIDTHPLRAGVPIGV